MTGHANLDTDALRTFVLGFELGSFARAAERVGRSQSAVSTQLRRLEAQVGQKLVSKAGRGLALTEAGERLLSYARRIVDLNDETLDALRGSELEGWVRLGLPQDFAEAWLPDVLGRFARSHPRVKVEVRAEKTGALVEKTMRDDLDMCLHWGTAPGAAHVEPIARLPMQWIGRMDWPTLRAGLEEPIPLVAFEPPCSFRDPAIAALDRAGIPWRLAFTSPSLSALWAAAAAGLGLTIRTHIGVPEDLEVLEPSGIDLPALPAAILSLVQAQRDQERPITVLKDILLGVIRERLP